MFNLRTPVKTAIEALALTYVEKVVDYGSKERGLQKITETQFDEGCVLLGDWVQRPEVYIKGWNLVKNDIELIVCAKSATAKDALIQTVLDLTYGLNRARYSRSDCLDTIAKQVDPTTKHLDQEAIHYQIITLEVDALESTTQDQENPTFSLPTISITRPSLSGTNYAVSTGTPGELVVETLYTLGDFGAGSIYYFVTPSTSGSALPLPLPNVLAGGTDSVTFSNITPAKLNLTNAGVYDYTIYAIFLDLGQVSAITTKSITFTIT